MAQDNPQPQNTTPPETPPQAIIDATPNAEKQEAKEDQVVEFLREMQENAGQILELATEEENLVMQFFNSMLKILKPFSKTLEISVTSLPERYQGKLSKAYLYLTGELILVYTNGETEILSLTEKENHEVLMKITPEIMAQLKNIINAYRLAIEDRVKSLMPIVKELQKVAEVFSEK